MIVVRAMTSTSCAPAAMAEIVEDGSAKEMSIPPLSSACATWVPPGMFVSLISIPFFRKKPLFFGNPQRSHACVHECDPHIHLGHLGPGLRPKEAKDENND